jgi:ABC-type multidrug transport system ATPase subunit
MNSEETISAQNRAAISVRDIGKSYGKGSQRISALQGISFEVQPGEIFGLIGPDGAGKTSMMRILTSLLLPDAGEAKVEGLDVVKDYAAIRRRVGYMPGKFSLYPDLTVEENLVFFATIFNTTIQENYHLVKDIYSQIEPFSNRKAGKLSGGMKQKLALSCALIHRPAVLFLDEPTTGVDAVSRREFWEMLQALKSQGITILVSTPYMDEARQCDRIGLIQDGRILQTDTPGAIVQQFPHVVFAIRSNNMLALLRQVGAWEEVLDIYPFGEWHHLVVSSDKTADLLRRLETEAMSAEWKEIEADIEDCFIYWMKNE